MGFDSGLPTRDKMRTRLTAGLTLIGTLGTRKGFMAEMDISPLP